VHVSPPANLGDPSVSLAPSNAAWGEDHPGWSVFEAGSVEKLHYFAMRSDSKTVSIASEYEFNASPAVVTFTDAAGLRWRRRGIEQPVRVLGPERGDGAPA